MNDVLKLNCTGIQSLLQFSIYNRYGQTVYEQQNCSRTDGWDGTFKGGWHKMQVRMFITGGPVDYTGKNITGKETAVLVR